MKSRFLLPIILAILVSGIFIPAILEAQTEWKIPILIEDGPRKDTLLFGFHPLAVGCQLPDTMVFGDCDTVIENDVPPDPILGVFEAKFTLSQKGLCPNPLPNGTKAEIHPYPFSGTVANKDTTFLLYVQSQDGYDSIKLSWPANLSNYANSIKLVCGSAFNLDMTKQTSVTFDIMDVGSGVAIVTIKVPPAGIKAFATTFGVPALTYPPDNTQDVPFDTTLTWTAATNATVYHVQVATNLSYTNPLKGAKVLLYDTTVATTSLHVTGLAGKTQLYWRVRPGNTYGAGHYLGWGCNTTSSGFMTFFTKPPTPKPMTPGQNGTNVATPTVFRWHKSLYGDTYKFQLSKDNFTTFVKDTSFADTTITLATEHCSIYKWRLSATNGKGTSADTTLTFSTSSVVPSAPVPALPANNDSVRVSQPTLSWTGDACSQQFHLQVSRDTGFTAGMISFEATVTTLSAQVDPLIGLTDYYWRVNATGTSGTSGYSVRRKFSTSILPPTKPVALSPIGGATVASPTPLLVWSQSFNNPAFYHLQLDTNANFAHASFFIDDSTLVDTSDTTPSLQYCTHYFWRVLAKNSMGGSPYTAASDFYTQTQSPGTPSPGSPADNATGLPASVTISWASSDVCAKQYILQVAYDAGFSTMLLIDTLWGTLKQLDGLPGETDFYWKVAAYNSATGGGASPFTTARKFTTGIFIPSAPVIIAPAQGQLNNGDSVRFIWHASNNKPRYYILQIDTSTTGTFGGSPWINDSTITDTTYLQTGLFHCFTHYTWRLSAKNPAGNAFTGSRTFQTPRQLAGAPVLLAPADREDSVADKPLFTWKAGDACTQSYIFQLSTDSEFHAGNIPLAETLNTASVQVTQAQALHRSTVYFWRVFSVNELGTGDAATYRFTTRKLATPDTVSRTYPLNGAVKVILNPLLQWDSTESAQFYRLQVAFDTAFSVKLVDDSTITTFSRPIGPLPNNTTFYWRMNARNDIGIGKWNTTWSFTTYAPPPAPTLLTPQNTTNYVDPNPTFQWGISDGAESYQIVVSDDSLFGSTILSDSITTTIRLFTPSLNGWTRYYWKVRAWNQGGWGVWSAAWTFKTRPVRVPDWDIPLGVAETGPMHDTLYFGIRGTATYGIDPSLNEFELPPPTFGTFDARFVDIDSRPGLLGQGLRVNQLPFDSFLQVDTFKVAFQPGIGTYPMKFSWPLLLVQDICDSMFLIDEFGGHTVHVRMDSVATAVVTNSGISSLLIIEYAARPTGVMVHPGPTAGIPRGYQLYQNYPNPFNPTTRIQFSTEYAAKVRLMIYDVLGRVVAEVADGTYAPGLYEVQWDGKSGTGMTMPSGVYYARILMSRLSTDGSASDRFTSTRKMLMIK